MVEVKKANVFIFYISKDYSNLKIGYDSMILFIIYEQIITIVCKYIKQIKLKQFFN